MEIKRNSWMYKVAYGFEAKKPKRTNLCSFFWKFVLMLLGGWPLALIAMGVFFALGVVVVFITFISGFFAGFFVGYRPSIYEGESRKKFWIPYKKWPKIKGYRILPIYFVLPVLVYFAVNVLDWTALWIMLSGLPAAILSMIFGMLGVLSFLAIAAIIFLLMAGIVWGVVALFDRFFKTGIGTLIKEYVKAKKRKVCPIIKFIG